MKPTTEIQFQNVRAIAKFTRSIPYAEYRAGQCPVMRPVGKAFPGCIIAHAFHARTLAPAVLAHIDQLVGKGYTLDFHANSFSNLVDTYYGKGAHAWFLSPPEDLDDAINALDKFAGSPPQGINVEASTFTFKSNPDGTVEATRTTKFTLPNAAAMLQFIKDNGITP